MQQKPTSHRPCATWTFVNQGNCGKSTVARAVWPRLPPPWAWMRSTSASTMVGTFPTSPTSASSWSCWMNTSQKKCFCRPPVDLGLRCRISMPRRRSVKSNFNNYEIGITEFICVFAEEFTWNRSTKADMLTWSNLHWLCHGAPAHCQPCQATEPSSANASMALCARTPTSNGCQSGRTQPFWQRSWPWPKWWIDNALATINTAALKVHFVDFKCITQPTWRTTSPLWHQLLRLPWQHLKPHTTGNMAMLCKRSPSTLASSWNSMSKASLQPFELCRSSIETLDTLQRHLWLNFWAPEVRVQMFYKLLVPMFAQHVSATRNPTKLHHQLWPKATTSTNNFKLMSFGSKMVTRSLRFFHALTLPPSTRLQPWCLMRKPPTW